MPQDNMPITLYGLRQAHAYTIPIPPGTAIAGVANTTCEQYRTTIAHNGSVHISQSLLLAVLVPDCDWDDFLTWCPFVTLTNDTAHGTHTAKVISERLTKITNKKIVEAPKLYANLLHDFSENVVLIGSPEKIRVHMNLIQEVEENKRYFPFICTLFWSRRPLNKTLNESFRVSKHTILSWLGGTVLKVDGLVLWQSCYAHKKNTNAPIPKELSTALTIDQTKALAHIESWQVEKQELLSTLVHRGFRLGAKDAVSLLEPTDKLDCLAFLPIVSKKKCDRVAAWNSVVMHVQVSARLQELKNQQSEFLLDARGKVTGGVPDASMGTFLKPSQPINPHNPLTGLKGFKLCNDQFLSLTIFDDEHRRTLVTFAPVYFNSVAKVHDQRLVDILLDLLNSTVQGTLKGGSENLWNSLTASFDSSVEPNIIVKWVQEVLLDTNSTLCLGFQNTQSQSANPNFESAAHFQAKLVALQALFEYNSQLYKGLTPAPCGAALDENSTMTNETENVTYCDNEATEAPFSLL